VSQVISFFWGVSSYIFYTFLTSPCMTHAITSHPH
jgi:hypothetical protein